VIGDDELRRQLVHAAEQFPVRGWCRDLQRHVVRRRRIRAGFAAAVGVVTVVAVAVAVPVVTGSRPEPNSTVGPTSAAGHQSPAASPGGSCASQSHPANFADNGFLASSITVCPGRAPVGAVVRITLQGCNIPSQPPAALVFLGPSSFIGAGGAGNEVPFKMAGDGRFTATFTIPATYLGGESGASPNPTLPVRPGDHYAFATYPAGDCSVPFTVTGGIRNLAISIALRTELTAAYAAYKRISPADIAGTNPGSVHYAYDPATDTYWALANFTLSATAPPRVTVNFQDGTSWGFFTKVGSGPWRAQEGGEPIVCLEVLFFPRAVLTAWSLPTDTASFGC